MDPNYYRLLKGARLSGRGLRGVSRTPVCARLGRVARSPGRRGRTAGGAERAVGGSTLRSLSSEDGRAELLVEGWPDEELLSFLPLDRDDCAEIWNTYEPIMEHLGLRYAWQCQDDVVRITVERQSGQ